MAHVGLPSVRSRPALEKDTPVTCRVQPSCLASRRQPTPKTYWARSDLQGKRLKATPGDDSVRAGARHLACGRPNATAAGRGWPRPRLNSLLAGDEASSSGLVSPPVARGRCQARQFRGGKSHASRSHRGEKCPRLRGGGECSPDQEPPMICIQFRHRRPT
jgi:hypothetical protein